MKSAKLIQVITIGPKTKLPNFQIHTLIAQHNDFDLQLLCILPFRLNKHLVRVCMWPTFGWGLAWLQNKHFICCLMEASCNVFNVSMFNPDFKLMTLNFKYDVD